jgi:hypothetical protein
VQTKVLEKLHADPLKVFAVWFPLRQGDSREVAEVAGAVFTDPRVAQYWAPDWTLANLYGQVLDFPKDYRYRVAVDVYLVFDEHAQWREEVPRPSFWMHQLGNDARRLDADGLRTALADRIREAAANQDCTACAAAGPRPAPPPSPP